MNIDIITSDPRHPVVPWLESWVSERGVEHDIVICNAVESLRGGDILFLVSCSVLIDQRVRARYQHCLVIHASDLPRGRGWSPHIWAILEGASHIVVTLLDAADKVDTGAIWAQSVVQIGRDWLHDEIHEALFRAEVGLMDEAINLVHVGHNPRPQSEVGATYLRRRTPADSELDPTKSLEDLFDNLRVADPVRYPCFFWLRGRRFELLIRERCEG